MYCKAMILRIRVQLVFYKADRSIISPALTSFHLDVNNYTNIHTVVVLV